MAIQAAVSSGLWPVRVLHPLSPRLSLSSLLRCPRASLQYKLRRLEVEVSLRKPQLLSDPSPFASYRSLSFTLPAAPGFLQYELRQLENEFSTLKLQNRDLRELNRRHTEELSHFK